MAVHSTSKGAFYQMNFSKGQIDDWEIKTTT
jgi:hypothetical protein